MIIRVDSSITYKFVGLLKDIYTTYPQVARESLDGVIFRHIQSGFLNINYIKKIHNKLIVIVNLLSIVHKKAIFRKYWISSSPSQHLRKHCSFRTTILFISLGLVNNKHKYENGIKWAV